MVLFFLLDSVNSSIKISKDLSIIVISGLLCYGFWAKVTYMRSTAAENLLPVLGGCHAENRVSDQDTGEQDKDGVHSSSRNNRS